jgi:16S rRNA (adenine1518-N6/adenine1519-N6)-dimethyltransferase
MIHRAKKTLGQHFLTSKAIINRIVATAQLSQKDLVLEIGPGKGILTAALLQSGTRVIAIEKDPDLIAHLQQTFAEEIKERQLMLIVGDALEFNPENYGLSAHHYKLVANIPYYITGEILRRFLSETIQPSRMVLLVQKEVAERVAANDGKESILSLSVKVYGNPRVAFRVSKKYFSPVPKIDSAVIDISAIGLSGLSRKQEARFFELVKQGFSQKRKQVVPLLSSLIPKEILVKTLAASHLPSTVRAEDIPLAIWKTLAFLI